MKIKEISVSFSYKFQLQQYEPVHMSSSITAELDGIECMDSEQGRGMREEAKRQLFKQCRDDVHAQAQEIKDMRTERHRNKVIKEYESQEATRKFSDQVIPDYNDPNDRTHGRS